MSGKEATIFIVDQGASMGRKSNGRDESDLDFAMRYVWDSLATIMITGRTTLTVGIVGFRTDETNNALEGEEGYNNISIMQPLGPIKVPDLKKLQKSVKPSKTDVGDAVSAIIIAIDMMERFTKKLKYARKIVLVTNGTGLMDSDDLDETSAKLNEDGIELVVLGVDFDDAEFGFKEEEKDSLKAGNEKVLRDLADKCEKSIFGTAAEAVQDLSIPRVKDYKPYATFKGQLTLGDPEKYDTALCIDVERYFRTKVAKAPSASSYVVAEMAGDDEGDVKMEDATQGEGLTAVKNARTYKIVDESAPGGKRDVDREDLAQGFEYGRTAVAIAESDQNITKLETVASFSIVGFIPAERYERFFNMGESCVTVAARANEKARLALSSLVHALAELESYAVARIVLKDGKDPQLVLLTPSIEPDLECLIDVPLPFAEDVRLYRFPPLDRVITLSGQTMTKHRNLPTDDLTKAMSAYVDAMDISTFGKDDEGNPVEYMAIEDTYSPVLHRINQAIRRRAVQPDEPVQPPPEVLMKYSRPPADLVKASATELDDLIKAADVKKVPPKAKGRRAKEAIKPLSGLNVDALLSREERSEISSENAIPEYKQRLGTAEDIATIESASKQMEGIIRSLIEHSLGDSGYGQAIANLGVMRDELASLEMPEVYNLFIRRLKEDLLKEKLGGDRRELWWEIKKARLGLVDKRKTEVSTVSEEEATEFYAVTTDIPMPQLLPSTFSPPRAIMSTITATALQTSYPPILPLSFNGNQPETIRLYPISNYTFGTKENQPEEDPSVLARLKRLEEHYELHGMRRTCEGILVCHEHNHPHILMLQIANAFFKLPGDYLKPEDDEIEGFKARLNERLAPVGSQFSGEGVNEDWEIGDTLAQWWRPNFETFMYPFIPAHVTRPKECKKLYFIQLPQQKVLSVPKNMKLLAVPLFDLYDNTARYGPQLSAIPHLLSRYNFEFVDVNGNVVAATPGQAPDPNGYVPQTKVLAGGDIEIDDLPANEEEEEI
ncbi:hypothetical protein V494_06292 [Pseudogymnoascus sp. VKM F-4513 (FW-928)]|nr:hypothetical protein V494_06292 [Pseudogymnoascus sp. VKM F-4513 (FW-928)]